MLIKSKTILPRTCTRARYHSLSWLVPLIENWIIKRSEVKSRSKPRTSLDGVDLHQGNYLDRYVFPLTVQHFPLLDHRQKLEEAEKLSPNLTSLTSLSLPSNHLTQLSQHFLPLSLKYKDSKNREKWPTKMCFWLFQCQIATTHRKGKVSLRSSCFTSTINY